MNKKEMLALLESIQNKITNSNIDDYSIDDKVAILEDVIRLRERTQVEIKYLQEKLSNDENYLDKTPYLYDESRRFNLEDHLELCQREELENNQNIQRYEELVDQMERNLPIQEEVSRKIIEELNEEIADMEADLRDSLNMTDSKFEELRSKLSELRTLREAHRDNIENGRKALENAKAKLQDLKDQEIDFVEAREQAIDILANFDKNVENRPRIDLEAKRADQRRLMVYTAELKSYEASERFASFDYKREIKALINDYKTDKISGQEVIEKVKRYKNYIVEDFLTDDMEARENNPEKEQLNQAEISCVSEIARLEKKLADDRNYTVSPFMVEKRERQLKKLRERINSIDDQIDAYNTEITAMQVDIETSEYMISELESEKREMDKTIRKAGANIDAEFEKDILTRIANRTTDIEYLQSVKLDCSRTMEHDATELGLLESKSTRYHEIYDRLEKNYETRNQYDTVSRRLDEQELTKLKSSLEAIRNRRVTISVSIYEDLENIINATFVPEEEQIKTEESELESENSTKKIEDSSKEEITQEEQERIDNILNGIEPFDKEHQVSSNNENKKLLEPDKDSLDPIGLGDTRGYKAKYSETENENLTKKAKKLGFVQKLKKWFKIVLMIATIGLVVIGLKRCSQEQLDSYMKGAQQDPTRFEQMTEDEIQNDIESQIGLPVQTNQQQQDQDTDETQNVEETEMKEETLGNVEEESVQLLPLDDIAKEVIKGKWGNGQERYDRLREAGYNVKEVQHRVNEMVAESEKKDNEKKETEKKQQSTEETTQDSKEKQKDETKTEEAVEVDITDGISQEEQEQILKDEGIEVSEDVEPVTVEEEPVYDFNVDDEASYGGFTESDQISNTGSAGTTTETITEGTTGEIGTTTDDTPTVSDDWGEFHETGTVTSNDDSQNLNLMGSESMPLTDTGTDSNVIDITVNNGESYVYNANDGTIYELNNGAKTNVEGANSFVELEDTKGLTQNSNGSFSLQVGGQTAEDIERDKPLTAEELQNLRKELAAKFGGDVVTQETIDSANADYQRGR